MNRGLHLVAHVGACGVLFDAERIDSVVDLGVIEPAPGAVPGVLGLAAMRSRVATVIDARRLLGLPATVEEPARRAAVTLVDGHLYAIAVDTLEDVVACEVVQPPAGLLDDDAFRFVDGVVQTPDETLMVVNVDRFVACATAGG